MPDDITPISKYASYQAEVVADIKARVQELGCQPVRKADGEAVRAIARSYNVSATTISRIEAA